MQVCRETQTTPRVLQAWAQSQSCSTSAQGMPRAKMTEMVHQSASSSQPLRAAFSSSRPMSLSTSGSTSQQGSCISSSNMICIENPCMCARKVFVRHVTQCEPHSSPICTRGFLPSPFHSEPVKTFLMCCSVSGDSVDSQRPGRILEYAQCCLSTNKTHTQDTWQLLDTESPCIFKQQQHERENS
jgi:hypothetical protein